MLVSDLYDSNPLRGQVVILAGSGASLGVYAPEFFNLFPVVTLNDTHRYLKVKPTLAFSNRSDFISDVPNETIKVVKGRLKWQKEPCPRKNYDNHVRFDSTDSYVFSYFSRELGDSRDHFDESELWKDGVFLWNVPRASVSIFALQGL